MTSGKVDFCLFLFPTVILFYSLRNENFFIFCPFFFTLTPFLFFLYFRLLLFPFFFLPKETLLRSSLPQWQGIPSRSHCTAFPDFWPQSGNWQFVSCCTGTYIHRLLLTASQSLFSHVIKSPNVPPSNLTALLWNFAAKFPSAIWENLTHYFFHWAWSSLTC